MCTTNFEDDADITVYITVDSARIIMQEKQNGYDQDSQVNPYKENEANKSNE